MATIVTRSGKGSPLTNTEVDANFTNLNNDKLETNAEVRAAVEAASDSNVFTDADHTKLNGVAASANNYSHPTGNGNNHIPSNGSSGQILGYASAGTAQWQAAPSSDLVDDTSPQLGGDLATNGHDVVMGNNDLIKLGTFSGQAAAGFIFSNGSTLNINSWGSTRLTGSNMTFAKAGGGEEYANFVADGATSLYHNNIKKFETTATGISVTGNATFADNDKAIFGAGSDLQIYHNGTNSIIEEVGTGAMHIKSNGSAVEIRADNDEMIAKFVKDDGARLYFNNSSKMYTETAGITVQGNITVTGTVDGRDIATNIPSSLGSAGQVLTVNSGASAAEWAAAGGGASASDDLYIANPSSATNPTAAGANAVSIGSQSEAAGEASLAAGFNATATAYRALALGHGADAGNTSISIGTSATSSNEGVALGRDATASGSESNALGHSSVSTATRASAIGKSRASGADSFAAAITNNSSSYGASGTGAIAMGYQAKATTQNSIAIGAETQASGFDNSICIGWQSTATSSRGAAVIGGRSNNSTGDYSTVLGGQGNTASGDHSVAMGDGSTASHNNSVSIGDSVQSTATNQINLGGTADTVRISEGYTLPTADGSANQVLTTNGSGAVSFAAAGGGASPSADLYIANPSSATNPTAAGANGVAIGDGAAAGGSGSISIGKGSVASALESAAIGQQSTASGVSSMAAGYNSVAHGAQSIAGPASRTSGSNSVAFGIGTNASSKGATGTSSIAIGKNAKASDTYATAIGYGTVASGSVSIAMGDRAQATGGGSICLAAGGTGWGAQATGASSVTIGDGAIARGRGKFSFASGNTAVGSSMMQSGQLTISLVTTNNTAAGLNSWNYGAAGADNQLLLPNNSAFAFHGTIVARQKASEGTACAAWRIEGLIRKEGSAGTTVLVNSATTVLDNTPNWGMALSADTTNGALKVQATGASSTNIRWTGTLYTSEVTYA